jgi:hypothetical protein
VVDQNALEGYRRALERRGRWVTFRRVGGNAPNIGQFDATVRAIIEGYIPEKPVAEISPEGSITQGARRFTVLQDDLSQKRFPLPLQKNDKVIIVDDVENPSPTALLNGESLNVISVDPFKRAVAGAVEILAVGA